MTEVLWPPDLCPASQTWSGLGNAAVFTGPFSGASRTYSRPGALMRCSITLPMTKGRDRARWAALLAALRDRGNRIWMPDFSMVLESGLPLGGSFPCNEVFANHNFASGTTGWTAVRCTLSVADRVLRLTNTKSGGANDFEVFQQNLSVTQYAPYALRSMIASVTRAGMSNGTWNEGSNYAIDRAGMVTQAAVHSSATTAGVYPGIFDAGGGASMAGDYAELAWTSFARCFQVDGGGNLLLQSDDFSTTWGATRAGITTNSSVAPDGTSTADTLSEDSTAANTHYVSQSVTVSSAAAGYSFSVAVKASGRSWVAVSMAESVSGTEAVGYFNVGTGAAASSAVGANWSNIRTHIVAMGGGWYCCTVTARKTNSATAVVAGVYAAEADGDRIFSGTSSASLLLWRGTMAQSSSPTRLVQSTAAAVSASTQTGSGIYVKGLPASTDGLLEIGDFVQVGAQMNRVTARLNSDAAGRGYLQCGNPFRYATNDAPVIVNTPMCKMMLATDSYDIDTGPGQFSPLTLELIEAID